MRVASSSTTKRTPVNTNACSERRDERVEEEGRSVSRKVEEGRSVSRKVGARGRRWMHDELPRREGGCRRKEERVEEGA